MKNPLAKPLLYFFFWLVYFALAKGVFLIYHYSQTADLTAAEITRVFLYGGRLDAAFAAYLCVLPFLIFFLETITPKFYRPRWVRLYTFGWIFLLSLLTAADLELYQAWGYRLDATPLQYIFTPAEMLASVAAVPLGRLLGIFLLLTIGASIIYAGFFDRMLSRVPRLKYSRLAQVSAFGCVVLLLLPMRGSVRKIYLVNQSDVYFSKKRFANHAAINIPWNILYSLSMKNYTRNPYEYFTDTKAQQYVARLHPPATAPSADSAQITLHTRRPNVLFIILESFTAKLIGCLGGEPGVTPQLDQLAREGILFTNIYASGDRSEKGLVALLSGYPVQTHTSIAKIPRKTERLPHLSQVLRAQGYGTSYYYGGEPAFANMKSYLVNAGFEKLVTQYDFDPATYNSKWGVHDHVLLTKWLQDFKQPPEPFFSVIFTLSSHEPYDAPGPARFPGTDEATRFKNSVYYTDQALGQFMAAAKKQAWWPRTLVVLVADHGHRLPGNDPNEVPRKFRIPLLLTGGALPRTYPPVSAIGSQTDVVPTLLAQLGLSAAPFQWGRNLLAPTRYPFAFYAFVDGFGFVTPAGAVTFDNAARRVISRDPGVPAAQLRYGQAYMQQSFADYLSK